MHGHTNIEFADARQAKEFFAFKNLKRKLLLKMGIIMLETC
jgi:hypothetical protein